MPLPPNTPPPVGPRGLAMRAAIQGADAYAAAAPLNACPYGDARPYSRRAWVAGYVGAARRAGLLDAVPGETQDEAAPWPGDAPAAADA